MKRLELDQASTLTIRTFAEGLLSRLAHDLAIEAHDVTGYAEDERVMLEVPVVALRVIGAVRRGVVDTNALSYNDREAIEAQLRTDVTGGGTVRVEGTREDGRARLAITTARGSAVVTCNVTATAGDDAASAEGRCDLSLRALGIGPVKGPLGAFRIADRVEVAFRLRFGR